MASKNYPVIVGVGQLTNRPKAIDDTLEPLEMMERIAREAEKDSRAPGLLEKADSVQVVNFMSWSYADAPGMLTARLGATPDFHHGLLAPRQIPGDETPESRRVPRGS